MNTPQPANAEGVGITELVAALETALRQWQHFSNEHRTDDEDWIEDSHDYEGQLYRQCKAVLTQAATAGGQL